MRTENCDIKIRVKKLPAIVQKLVNDKMIMQAYSRGEISKKELQEQGIKFVNPL